MALKGPCGKTSKKAGDECGKKEICYKCDSNPLLKRKKEQRRYAISRARCLPGTQQPVLAGAA